MPKAEKGSIKDIGKRIKSKGLQKLKFYCQMCEKQCRDANGFKCHLTSESHIRQMKIFSENASGIMDRYSRDFEKEYLQTLRQRHTTKRVNANNVYQEVIADKQHIHMNATRWSALSDFVMYLGKTGKCVVDETERGWYVQYIENDASILQRKQAQERRAEAEQQAEIAQAERMAHQRVEAAKAMDRAGGTVHREATKLERRGDDEPLVSLALKVIPGSTTTGGGGKKKKTTKDVFFDNDNDSDEEEEPERENNIIKVALPPTNSNMPASKAKRPAGEKDKPSSQEENTFKRQKLEKSGSNGNAKTSNTATVSSSKDMASHKSSNKNDDNRTSREEIPWLKRDIVVRIINKKLANGKYFRRKAVVDHVLKDDKFRAEVEVLDETDKTSSSGDILRLDQNDLDTVVPREGKKVRVLKGEFRGKKAKVVALDKKKYRATLKLLDTDEVLEKVDFEEFSQLA